MFSWPCFYFNFIFWLAERVRIQTIVRIFSTETGGWPECSNKKTKKNKQTNIRKGKKHKRWNGPCQTLARLCPRSDVRLTFSSLAAVFVRIRHSSSAAAHTKRVGRRHARRRRHSRCLRTLSSTRSVFFFPLPFFSRNAEGVCPSRPRRFPPLRVSPFACLFAPRVVFSLR